MKAGAQLQKRGMPFLLIGGMAAGLLVIQYFTQRSEHLQLFTSYSLTFGLYLLSYHFLGKNERGIQTALYAGIAFRFLLLFALPNLSDDVYRFIWDGRLIWNGINPFAALPSAYMQEGMNLPEGLTPVLFEKLNSPDYFTIYPPFAQLVFVLSTGLSDSILGSTIIMRFCVILAEIATLWVLPKLLAHYRLPRKQVLLYALNPLVILELTGNLHFEAFLIAFLLLSLYWLKVRQNTGVSALFMALSISSKLIPLIFLPLLLFRLPFKKTLKYYGYVGVFTLLFFLPLWSKALWDGMQNSLALYFQKFEFNASIYYLIREIGYLMVGYNIIGIAGKALALSTFVGIMGFTLWEKGRKMYLPQAMFWALGIYLLLTTTLHPWYTGPFLALSVLSRFRFPVLWTFLVFFTYRNYLPDGYEENLWVVSFEYLIVGIALLAEILYHAKRRRPDYVLQNA